jgi:hypothetical protein
MIFPLTLREVRPSSIREIYKEPLQFFLPKKDQLLNGTVHRNRAEQRIEPLNF